MEEKAKEILKILNSSGHTAYIVGGYVRDKLLGRKSSDIDICTSATPREILPLFENVYISNMQYGSVVIIYKGSKFDVTTFRKEIKYEKNRKPIKIKYIKDIKKDLLRRDFTINTLCIDKDGNTIDFLNIKEDLNNKILKTVGNPRYKIKEDALRILRCIRFATTMDLNIESKTYHYLEKYGYLLKNLSMERKKEELDKIFTSINKEKGRKILIDLNLTNVLNINKLNDIKLCTDPVGIWTQLEVDNIYPFTKIEKIEMQKLRELFNYKEIDNYLLYKYGLYLCTVYSDIKGLSIRSLNKKQSNLPILTRSDILVKGDDIAKILGKEKGKYIKDVIEDIEKSILDNTLENNYEEIKNYILRKY